MTTLLSVTLVAVGPSFASSVAGTDSRPIETPLFAPTSLWTTPLPAATPVDPNSAAVVADLWTTGEQNFGAPGKPRLGVNTTEYTPSVYVATNADPIATFKWDNCQGRWDDSGLIATQLTGLHVPAGALPSAGTDSEITIYNRDEHTYTDIWRATKKSDGTWTACWGGTIRNANTSTGIFPYPFGATATGLPFMGGTLRPSELAAGAINHVVGISLPYAKSSTQISWPANRGDGQNPNGYAVPAQGQIFRLPASLDIDAMNLSPLAKAVAKAAQKYGMVVWDTAAAISFRAENVSALTSDPYPALFRYRSSAQEFQGDPARGEQAFPLDKLELLPMNYQAPQPTPVQPTPTPTAPTPTPTTPPPPLSNLLSNPSFEVNLSGWGGWQASLAREAQSGAPAGGYVAKVTRSSGTSFTIDDGARAVSSTTAGRSYVAEAWVRAATASAVGKPIRIILRERTRAGTVVADVGSPNVALTNAWQRITISRVTTTTGGNLGVRVAQSSAATGNAFWVDAAMLRVGS